MFNGICYNRDIPRHKRSKHLFEKIGEHQSELETPLSDFEYCGWSPTHQSIPDGFDVKRPFDYPLAVGHSIDLELKPRTSDGWGLRSIRLWERKGKKGHLLVGCDENGRFWCCVNGNKYVSYRDELMGFATWFSKWLDLKKRITDLKL